MKTLAAILCFLLPLFCPQILPAYAENGHRVVGAMADRLLAGKPAGEKVRQLLGSISLERASTLPDELRGEDRAAGTFTLPENPALQAELLAFRAANPPNNDDLTSLPPSHHWFHYTDVPIPIASYAGTTKGIFKWDIVQMISFCARVLDGREPADNNLKITPAVAVVLLAHFIGDIHQPLHVGAIFLNENGEIRDPNLDPAALESRGGNDLQFGATNLHGYWDYDSVETFLSFRRRQLGKMADQFTARDLATELVAKEPANWKVDGALDSWSENWANQILPLAREAHDRLKILPREEFARPGRNGRPTLRWTVIERPHLGKDSYSVFASKAVERELPKAGFRLAALLEVALTPPSK